MLIESLIGSLNREEQEKVFLQLEGVRKVPSLLWKMSSAFGGYFEYPNANSELLAVGCVGMRLKWLQFSALVCTSLL